MASEQSEPIELRVLYGPQAGSRLALASGSEHVLGASQDCSIMLSGPRLAGEHAKIVFEEGMLRMTPLQGEVRDAQGNQKSEEFTPELGIPIELGGIWISLDLVSSPWPDSEAVLPIGSNQAAVPELAAPAPVVEDKPVRPVVAPAARSGKMRFSVGKLIVALGLVSISGVVVAAWIAGANNDDVEASAKAAAKPPLVVPSSISHAIAQAGAGGSLSAAFDGKGKWVVSGYVTDAKALGKLNTALEDTLPHPVLQVVVEDEMVAAANQFLQSQRFVGTQMLRADNAGAGKILLLGTAETKANADAAVKALKVHIPALREVQSNIAMPEQLLQILKEKIEAAGLAGSLRFVKESPAVMLNGNLTNDEVMRWQSLFVDFTRAYGTILPIDANVGVQVHTVALSVQSIVGGPSPYIVLASGERVGLGGAINGRTVVAIREGNVLFDGNETLRAMR
jgi:type III secretion system YscD/HrpQ family protein